MVLLDEARALPARILRLYADTSVFGGCSDEEFAEPSRRLFDLIPTGTFQLIVSDTTLLELQGAPGDVRAVLLYDNISGYHGVNPLRGYRPIQIFSPLAVV